MPPQTPHGSDSSAPLTKPADWAIYIIGATMEVVVTEALPLKYTSNDAGKLEEILKTLKFYEAHDKYNWPDFSSLGYDFTQTMRLGQSLIHDVYEALHNGGIHVEPRLVTLESSEMERKSGAQDGPMTSSKRRYQTNKVDETADETSSEANMIDSLTSDILARTMRELINQRNRKSEKEPSSLADIVHDALVVAWERLQARYFNIPQDLAKKKQSPRAPSLLLLMLRLRM
ncbi:hypothetical protein K505DRAFT_367230 [Melanomma pulvis-pyrius CBS 109.77]|uniref:Uncharacterized protein n=1 Tax=Melanomma pulvis-pyrius CBS 109.77 TaxID=1314802 RepID=A0A6A6WTS2_9PLEO|nr:hypothetical protein K505DRAFT_367230 [Melanomma pulvis-pyrius CBS 109.77]